MTCLSHRKSGAASLDITPPNGADPMPWSHDNASFPRPSLPSSFSLPLADVCPHPATVEASLADPRHRRTWASPPPPCPPVFWWPLCIVEVTPSSCSGLLAINREVSSFDPIPCWSTDILGSVFGECIISTSTNLGSVCIARTNKSS